MSEKNNDFRNEEFIDIYSQLLKEYADKEPPASMDPEPAEKAAADAPEQTRHPVNRKPPVKRKKKNSGLAIALAVVILLGGSIGVAAMAGMFNKESTPSGAEISATAAKTKKPEAKKTSKAPEKTEKEESAEDSSVLSYAPTGSFERDKKRLPAASLETIEKYATARYILLYDADADKVLFERDGTKKIYPASTTKMLTAIVGAKIIPADTVITVGEEIKLINWDSSTAGLMVGMKLTFADLMDALMLPSGNDAAYTIAVNAARMYTGNEKLSDEQAVKVFMTLVNEAAKGIGCKGTHYVTPDGWHDDDHYTCAEDLARIAAYARTIPLVMNSCAKWERECDLIKEPSEETKNPSSEQSQESEKSAAQSSAASSSASSAVDSEVSVEESSEEEEEEIYVPETLYWTNSNKLIQPESEFYSPYCDGMKTGFTDEAGTSVVASATMNGHTCIAVIMMGESLYKKYDDANVMFKEAFKLYGLNYTYSNEPDEPLCPAETSKSESVETSKVSSAEASKKTSGQ